MNLVCGADWSILLSTNYTVSKAIPFCYNSCMLILFRSKTAFVGHFLSELQKRFQLALSRAHYLTILGTAGV